MLVNNKKRIIYTALFAFSALAAIAYGRKFWLERRDDFLGRLYAPRDFQLLTAEGKIYNTGATRLPHVLYVFLPDILQQAHVRDAAKFFLQIRAAKKLEVVCVSRGQFDTVTNFLRATGFRGEILFDPSANFAKAFGIWKTLQETPNWHYLVLQGGRKKLVRADSETPIPYAEFKKSAATLF